MNHEQNLQPDDLDSLIGDNHLQMMKAALPYMNVPEQRFVSLFVKLNELRRTMRLFEDGDVAAMGICSAGEGAKPASPLEMLNAIKPYATPYEQDFIDLISNFVQGFRLAGSFSTDQAPVPSTSVPTEEQSEGQGRQNAPQQKNNGPFGRMPLEQLKNFIPPEQQSKLETMQLMMSAMQQMG